MNAIIKKITAAEEEPHRTWHRTEETMKLGALEAGGTKMVCALGDETGKIYE